MIIYSDFEKTKDKGEFIVKAINEHTSSGEYLKAIEADNYYKQKNTEILKMQKMFSALQETKDGLPYTIRQVDKFSPNNKLCSNFFNQFINQEVKYLLGNGLEIDENIKKS